MRVDVEHHPERSRFEAVVDGRLCVAAYRIAGTTMQLTHTEVHPAVAGRGVAAALVEAALAHARANGLTAVPRCSYVQAYVRRHPQTQGLLA